MMNLEGNIGEINLIERLVEMWREQFTGAIRFENDGIIKILYFKGGDILSASTNDRGDSIDEILMKAGKVSRDHVKQALAKRKENETLGDALLNLGFITRKELAWARRVQVVGVIRSIAAWDAGSFTIVADYLPKRDEGTLFPLPQIIVELTVTEPDRVRFESSMQGGDLVLEPSETFDSVFPTLGLNEDADAIAAAIDGTRSAREVANVSGRDTFNVYKLLHALSLLGVLRESAGLKATPEVSLDQFDFGASAEPESEQAWEGLSHDNAPTFDLDDAPSLDLPSMGEMRDAPPAAVATASPIVWDDPPAWESPDQERVSEPEPSPAPPKSVVWEPPVRESYAVPVPAPIEPPTQLKEEQWGFDEAQLETSRRAIPPPSGSDGREREGRKRSGLFGALLLILVLAGAAYGGWLWWSAREASQVAEAEPVRTTPAPAPTPAAPVETGTIVPVPTTNETVPPNMTTAPTTTTVAATATTTTAPAPAPLVTTAPAPTAAPVAVSADRQRLDAMAGQFAANPAGRYTIQIQILCDPSNVAQAMTRGGGQLWFLPQPLGTRACYRVFWGRFESEAEARGALQSIPAALRDPNAAVKAIPRG